MKKIDAKESNLLQEIFDAIWYKLFPNNMPKTTKEELQELFPTLPAMIEYKLPKKMPKEGIFIPVGETFPLMLEFKVDTFPSISLSV